MIIIYKFVHSQGTNKTMDKSKEKRNSYNPQVIKEISLKYGVTPRYVRMCINEDRTGIFPYKVLKEYEAIEKRLAETLTTAINE